MSIKVVFLARRPLPRTRVVNSRPVTLEISLRAGRGVFDAHQERKTETEKENVACRAVPIKSTGATLAAPSLLFFFFSRPKAIMPIYVVGPAIKIPSSPCDGFLSVGFDKKTIPEGSWYDLGILFVKDVMADVVI